MGLVVVRFDVEGQRQISRAFDDMALDVSDMSDPLNDFMDGLIGAVRAQFDTEGTSGLGRRWRKLSEPYRKWKLKHYGPRPILVRQGGMKGAALNRRTAVRVTPKRAVYEPRNSYIGYHQSGAGRLPVRKIIALTTAQKREMVDRSFHEWIHKLKLEHVNGAGV